jgi:hypothetical protein
MEEIIYNSLLTQNKGLLFKKKYVQYRLLLYCMYKIQLTSKEKIKTKLPCKKLKTETAIIEHFS